MIIVIKSLFLFKSIVNFLFFTMLVVPFVLSAVDPETFSRGEDGMVQQKFIKKFIATNFTKSRSYEIEKTFFTNEKDLPKLV